MTSAMRLPLQELVFKTLRRRHEAGLALYREFHPGHIITSMEQLATEDGDWNHMVAPHKEALDLAPIVLAYLRRKEVSGLDEEHLDLLIDSVLLDLKRTPELPRILIQGVVQPYGEATEGILIRALALPWRDIVGLLVRDWTLAYSLSYREWEELIAASFDRAGYDEVILTPRSGDHGRDVIAVKKGVGSVRIIDSVKAFKPNHLVRHDDVRALVGVLLGDLRATKGIVTTTADFAPGISSDPFLAPLMPYRLELMNRERLREWLEKLALEDKGSS